MAKKPKAVLAYSGGLDTSVILKWLTLKGYDVIAYAANLGQREEFDKLEGKAKASGASKFYLVDVREDFIKNFVFPAIKFDATYEGRYLLGTSLARPVIAKEMVRIAELEKAEYVSHGATGKGNDQVRFELTAYSLNPDIKVIAPWRDPEFNSLIRGRAEAIKFAKEHNIPIKASFKQPWSQDENIMHLSFESGILEDPSMKPPKEMFELTVSPQDAPDKVTTLSIEFEKGEPVAVNGKRLNPVKLLETLNKIGGENGVGRIDMVESRYIGMKSRGVYETPGGTILHIAHRDIEGLTLDRGVTNLKDTLMPRFAQLVYNGYWFSREMETLLAFLEESQKYVYGKVNIELYKGNVTVVGRESEYSLYDPLIASMDWDQGVYDQAQATGFINICALPLKVHRRRMRKIQNKK